jgi:hypothetical protein
LSEVDFAYQTPKRLKVGVLLEALAETIPVGIGKTDRFESIEDPMLVESGAMREAAVSKSIQIILAEWNKVCAGFEIVNAEFTKLGAGESKYRDAISSTVVRIHEAIREAGARTALLEARVGRDHTDASDLGSETVWDAIRRLCDTLGEVPKNSSMAATEIPNLVSQQVDPTTKMSTLSKNLHGLRQFTQKSLESIHQCMIDHGGSPQGGGPAFNRPSV